MNKVIVFDGKKFAEGKERELLGKLGELARLRQGFGEAKGKLPKLVAILVGNSAESELYLKLKEKKAKEIGIDFEWGKFNGENEREIIDYIERKSSDPEVNGIVVELPLPKGLGKYDILDKIKPEKDVDCLTSKNRRLLEEGRPRFIPPTVRAVGEVLKVGMARLASAEASAKSRRGKEKLEAGNKKIVVVGSEGTVGKGIVSYLRYLDNLCNLRGIDKETEDLASVTKEADILISATGVGHLIKREMVKPGAIVIDVGIEKQPDGSLKGDVDFENVKEVASFITPVPGGVGPVTVVCLMENLLEAMYH